MTASANPQQSHTKKHLSPLNVRERDGFAWQETYIDLLKPCCQTGTPINWYAGHCNCQRNITCCYEKMESNQNLCGAWTHTAKSKPLPTAQNPALLNWKQYMPG